MRGNAWLAVQALDGTEAYTRAGALDVDAEGTLVTTQRAAGAGRRRTDHRMPPNAEVQIAADGTISATWATARRASSARLKLVTPEAPLQRGADGLFRAAERRPAGRRAARVQDGALEGSNVSPVENMVAMIAAARQFEQQMKLMQTAGADEQAASQAAVAS
jgi:flagellar basal-body rod protein FlgF